MLTNSPKILKIKSDKSELKKVNEFLSEIFMKHNLPQKKFNNVFLCISEAVINSIEHGNNNNSNILVSIGIDSFLNKIHINIKDDGEGFDFRKVEDPTCSENVKKETGRGIHIIKSLSDNVEYNEKGNSVRFKIKF